MLGSASKMNLKGFIPILSDGPGRRVRNGEPVPPEARPARPRRDAGARASPNLPGAGDNGPQDGTGMIPPKAAGALASTLTSKPIRSLLNGSTRQNGGGPGRDPRQPGF